MPWAFLLWPGRPEGGPCGMKCPRILSCAERGPVWKTVRASFTRQAEGSSSRSGGNILFMPQDFRAGGRRFGQPSCGMVNRNQDGTVFASGVPFSSILFHSLLLIIVHSESGLFFKSLEGRLPLAGVPSLPWTQAPRRRFGSTSPRGGEECRSRSHYETRICDECTKRTGRSGWTVEHRRRGCSSPPFPSFT
jgi:hypothetical protein